MALLAALSLWVGQACEREQDTVAYRLPSPSGDFEFVLMGNLGRPTGFFASYPVAARVSRRGEQYCHAIPLATTDNFDAAFGDRYGDAKWLNDRVIALPVRSPGRGTAVRVRFENRTTSPADCVAAMVTDWFVVVALAPGETLEWSASPAGDHGVAVCGASMVSRAGSVLSSALTDLVVSAVNADATHVCSIELVPNGMRAAFTDDPPRRSGAITADERIATLDALAQHYPAPVSGTSVRVR